MNRRIVTAVFHLSLLFSGTSVMAMAGDGGPMNADWFYSDKHFFKIANWFHQNKNWEAAADEYKRVLKYDFGTEYDKQMAQLNMAACLMAQRRSAEGWAAFDLLLDIPKEQCISKELIEEHQDSKSVLVRTDKVGVGDIYHFLKAAAVLKERTGWDVTVSVRNFLKEPLFDALQNYGLTMVGENDEQPHVDYVTHLIGLLGHLEMSPAVINPEKVMFTTPEKAMHRVSEKVYSVLAKKSSILAVVFKGEVRQATLIGGKQLPRGKAKHGRHLLSAPFGELLKKHPEVTLMDCGGQSSRVAVEEGQKDRYMVIPKEEQLFDTIVALARIMSVNKRIVCFGSDNGRANIFARALDADAQDRMAFIIPNGDEYDMRMEGEGLTIRREIKNWRVNELERHAILECKGSFYKQMISNCWVYKCESPENMTDIVDIAYQEMIA